ncbi:uncharacterized protein LOC124447210 [Xenia sp. Carnegie-2017]|uniref:uncharacterized protein LOC124447210 n=1 Tax=Xenia sp. Carnegie-2017 TaxID=2897299 RepID=UPI001F0415D3|nr:uncharacterized protein LOC124447210 [Xenia sp. Carnegie-2017]
MLKELQETKIISSSFKLDAQMFSMRSSRQVFELLWCLVCHDIWFVWSKSNDLQQTKARRILGTAFSWVPSKCIGDEEVEKKFSKSHGYPEPDACILEMINAHLKMTREGRMLSRGVMTLDDLTDSRVLCALVNSFVPETFTTEVLLNDRWTVNLALRTANEFFKSSSSFDASDLAQADIMSVCSYFAFFFMCGYKLRQSRAALQRMNELLLWKLEIKDDLEKMEAKKFENAVLEEALIDCKQQIHDLEQKFDLGECSEWMKDIAAIQNNVRTIVSKRIQDKYDIIRVPRNMTISDLTVSLIINLSLTSGVGYYELRTKEVISRDRKIILQNTQSGFNIFFDATGEFVDDVGENQSLRAYLGIKDTVDDINPRSYPDYKIFAASPSRNKILKAGSLFLYQIFPGSTLPCQRLLFKATKSAEIDTVKKLVTFFQSDKSFINSKESGSGNTALHLACRHGHFDLVQYLLEHGAHMDALNNMNCTPFFAAVSAKQREVAELLIEWGANIFKKNSSGKTAFEIINNEIFTSELLEKDRNMRSFVRQVVNGDIEKLTEVIEQQSVGGMSFRSLRSRCLKGSTLLHTATHFGEGSLVKILLKEGVNIDLPDYKGATALHRVKDKDTLKILLEAGANIDAVDDDGNTPLHVFCYGDHIKDDFLQCMESLLNKKPLLTARNHKGMMAVHYCALHGRVDVVELLLEYDQEGLIKEQLSLKNKDSPSILFLALANDQLDVACWLNTNKFAFYPDEADQLMQKIIFGEMSCSNYLSTMQFLLDHGGDPGCVDAAGNTLLHYVAANPDLSELLEMLVEKDADVNALNTDAMSPLFFAAKSSCIYNASVLIANGADIKLKNYQGLTALDFITDFEEWKNSGFFNEEMKARLKAYSLKHSKDLVRAISIKVKGTVSDQRTCSSSQNPMSLRSHIQHAQKDLEHISFPRQISFR